MNVIVAGKQPSLQFLDMDAAVNHCTAGVKIWEWASNDRGTEPDAVMVCAGDVPTLAAVTLLHEHAAELRIRVVTSRPVISVTATAFCRVSITQPVLSGAVSVRHWRRRRTDRPVSRRAGRVSARSGCAPPPAPFA